MPKNYQSRGIHTCPENAGVKNMTKVDLPKDEDNLMEKIMPVYKKGRTNYAEYKGQWTAEQLAASIQEFFDYCCEAKLKPTQPALALWLSVDKSTLWEWRKFPNKYGEKSKIIKEAYDAMECYLQSNLDKYPTGSIFLLKTSFGHVETTNVNVTSEKEISKEDIGKSIADLGLGD